MAIDHALAQRIVEYLNGLVALDPEAMGWLVTSRVPCNDAFARKATAVIDHGDVMQVGIVGILAGLCGGNHSEGPYKGWAPIGVVLDENGRAVRFGMIEDLMPPLKRKGFES